MADKDTGMKDQLLMGRIYYDDHSNAVSRLQGKTKLLLALAEKQSLITTNEARDIALNFLRRNGYDLRKSKTKVGSPWVRQARYRLEDPLEPPMPLPAYSVIFVKKGVKQPEWNHVLMEIEVSGLTKKITRFTSSPFLFKAVSVDLTKFPSEPELPKRE